ncbi:MAG: TonB-dependent receptor plug domain-containing protein [Vicinamibacterales bacterium]
MTSTTTSPWGRAVARAAGLLLALALLIPSSAAGQSASPLGGWETALATLERRAQSGEPAGAVRADLEALNESVAAWLARHGAPAPPAASGSATVPELLDRARDLLARAEAVSGGAFYLGRIEVSVTADSVTPGATVLDAVAMQAVDARTVDDALAAAPGVALQRMGPRNEGMVTVRGFDLRQIPLFVDGVPVYVPYDGYVDLDRFTTDDLAEVRVTRGMTSVLLGPNALGGAINLVTKRPTGRLDGTLHASYGSGRERALDAGVGTRAARGYVQATGSWLAADSFPLSGAFDGSAVEDGGDRDNASHDDRKGSVKAGWTPARGGEYAISYVGQRGQKDVPTYAGDNPAVRRRYWRWPDWDKDAFYVVANTPLAGSQYLRGRLFYDRFYNELDAYDDATFSNQRLRSSFRSIYDDYATGASAEYGTALGGHHLLRAALHLKDDVHREHNVGEPVRHFENRILSAGVEDTITLTSRVTLLAGVGVDRQTTVRAEDFVNGVITDFPAGSADGVNPQAGLYVATPEGGRLRATVSRKTRLPAIKDRYSYRLGQAVPNPDLAAERATTVEAGYDGAIRGWGSVALAGFHGAIGDLVQPVFLRPNLFQLQNVGDIRQSGLEAEWRSPSAGGLRAIAGYSYLRRSSDGTVAVPLLNVPSQKLTGTLTYTGPRRLQVTASLLHESSRMSQDDAGVALELPAYTTVFAKAAIGLGGGADVEASASNLFDADYVLYPGFPEPGRIVRLQVRVRF